MNISNACYRCRSPIVPVFDDHYVHHCCHLSEPLLFCTPCGLVLDTPLVHVQHCDCDECKSREACITVTDKTKSDWFKTAAPSDCWAHCRSLPCICQHNSGDTCHLFGDIFDAATCNKLPIHDSKIVIDIDGDGSDDEFGESESVSSARSQDDDDNDDNNDDEYGFDALEHYDLDGAPENDLGYSCCHKRVVPFARAVKRMRKTIHAYSSLAKALEPNHFIRSATRTTRIAIKLNDSVTELVFVPHVTTVNDILIMAADKFQVDANHFFLQRIFANSRGETVLIPSVTLKSNLPLVMIGAD